MNTEREYKIPCGRTTGMGSNCDIGQMCAGCAEIARLRLIVAERPLVTVLKKKVTVDITAHPERVAPVMGKSQIEDVLGTKFRRMLTHLQQDEHLPMIKLAVKELALHLKGDTVVVYAGSHAVAKNFSDRLGKKLFYISEGRNMMGIRFEQIFILRGSLSNRTHRELSEILVHARDAIIWNIYEW